MQYRKREESEMALHTATLVRSSMSSHNLLRITLSLIFISTLFLHTASAASTSSNALNTKTSVYLALNAAKSASTTLNKLSKSKGNLTQAETEVIADCKDNIGDTVDLIQQSADGLEGLNGVTTEEERFQWDDIKTWMSSCITDESTCTDEFDEMVVRPSLQKKIKPTVAIVAQKSSIALALVNRLFY